MTLRERLRASRWWREPMLHFVVLGALLWGLDAYRQSRHEGRDEAIIFGSAQIRALQRKFEATWGRAPDAVELKGLIDEALRDEVESREATRMGLDKDDLIIRRRLAQKYEIVVDDSADQINPTDEQLEAYRRAHEDVYRAPGRIAFEQVFFDPTRRGARLHGDVAAAMRALEAGRTAATRLGDPLFVLQPRYALSDERQIATVFGEAFARDLHGRSARDAGHWIGPIESGYGLHLVRIAQMQAGEALPLTRARAAVERDWRDEQRRKLREASYRAALARYRVRIEFPAPAASIAGRP